MIPLSSAPDRMIGDGDLWGLVGPPRSVARMGAVGAQVDLCCVFFQ